MEKGLRYDRRWMLVDENGRFLTQREHPAMALFKVSMQHDGFVVENPKKSSHSISVPFENNNSNPTIKVQIWDDEVYATEVNPSHSHWFSECLNIKCQLVFFPESNTRPVDIRYAGNNENVSLADAYPYLIIGEASRFDLNEKLEDKVGMNRFRPNFVFTGGNAFEEDSWNNFTIGDVSFYGAKPCARCVLTTIDPETATKGVEPLKTLSFYRKVNAKVLFGQNVLAREQGIVKEGDVIEIIDLKK